MPRPYSNPCFKGRTLRTFGIAFLCALGPSALAAQPRDPDPANSAPVIVAVVQRFIDAMMAQDTAYLRAASLPQATVVVSQFPAAPTDTVVVRPMATQIANIGSRRQRWVGRVWTPTITVNGNTAVFIAPYDSWSDGKFSNCGMDHYILARSGERWLVSQLLYTVQRAGCTPSPLGPPP